MDPIAFPTIQQTIRKLKDDNTFERQYTSLLDYDIIPTDDPDRLVIQNILNDKKHAFESLSEERSLACFVGSAIGDALGNQTDLFPLDYSRNIIENFKSLNDLRCPRSLYTDDTSLALCLADSFLCNEFQFNPSDIRHRFVLWWFEGYNNGKSEFFKAENAGKEEYSLKEVKQIVKDELWDQFSFGIGIATFNSFIDFVRFPSKERISEHMGNMNSNGSLMRLASIPILFHDNLKQGFEIAEKQSLLTNDGREAAECCQLLTGILIGLFNDKADGSSKDKIDRALLGLETFCDFQTDGVKCIFESKAETSFYEDSHNKCIEDRDWNWKKDNFKYSPTRVSNCPTGIGGYSNDALAMSLHINYTSTSFSQVVLRAANLGGDSDTVGCISGMIAGAIYGLSEDLKEMHKMIYPAEQNKTLLRAYKLFHKKV